MDTPIPHGLINSIFKMLHHYMGTSTFANHTVLPEIALAKIREDAPFDKVCYIGCGVTTGIGAVINTAKVEAGSRCIVFGLGGIGLNVIQGAKLVGADMIVGYHRRRYRIMYLIGNVPRVADSQERPNIVSLTGILPWRISS